MALQLFHLPKVEPRCKCLLNDLEFCEPCAPQLSSPIERNEVVPSLRTLPNSGAASSFKFWKITNHDSTNSLKYACSHSCAASLTTWNINDMHKSCRTTCYIYWIRYCKRWYDKTLSSCYIHDERSVENMFQPRSMWTKGLSLSRWMICWFN